MKILISNKDPQINFSNLKYAIWIYCRVKDIPSANEASWGAYILIDEKKRKIYHASSVELLISQVEFIGNTLTVSSEQFIKKVKELGWGQRSYTNEVGVVMSLKPGTQKIVARPERDPCKYCGKKHLDYACDAQIQAIRKASINMPKRQRKCRGCNKKYEECICTEHEKECTDCP